MVLTPEWDTRIKHWQDVLPKLFFRPLQTVELEGFATHEQLTASEAAKKKFKKMPVGTAWGARWEYGWFRTQVKLNKEMRGQHIVIDTHPGPETCVYLNGVDRGGLDWKHAYITLTRKAKGAETFDVLMETYAGHGHRIVKAGPCPADMKSIPDSPALQCEIEPTRIGVWHEQLFQLWMDVNTLYELRGQVEKDSLRQVQIDAGLREMTVLFDPELPIAEMDAGVKAARACLQPLLACSNGSTAPTMYCFGHSHIDVAWLWTLRETESKCTRTLGTVLELIDEYPDFKFLQPQPHLYWMIKNKYPALYKRIKKAIQRGQMIAEGGMWVEADTNLSSGESLIRQFIHGKRFYKEEFGVESELLWLPDVFGYAGSLPQIMAGCGIKYFSTSKLFWIYNGGEPFPHNQFWWEGIDGTRTFSFIHDDYNSDTNPETLVPKWRDRRQKDLIDSFLVPFGWGDGGGGPTRQQLEYVKRAENLEGHPRMRMSHPNEFFTANHDKEEDMPTYVGELYLQCHRGTYTSQAKTKLGNRRSELALRDLEMWAVGALAKMKSAYPQAALESLWRSVLLNQFHDIIPGSSIAKVYEEAEAEYAQVLAKSAVLTDVAQTALLTQQKDTRTVFNSLSWARDALVPLPHGWASATVHGNETPLPMQTHDGVCYVRVPAVPSCGWTTLQKAAPVKAVSALKVSKSKLENEYLCVRLNSNGEITSILDKETGRELTDGVCNAFHMYRDVPNKFDAWDIDSPYRLCPVSLPKKGTVAITAKGPLFVALSVRRQLHDSVLQQEIRLEAGSRRIDFITSVDWQEKHKLLKVNFPVALRCENAHHEIQFGHVQRPTHDSRQFDADRFEVCNQKWTALTESNRGVAILNDCKYGIDVSQNSINLTLLKSALAPDMKADVGLQIFTYSFYAWNGSLPESGVVQEAYALNVPVTSCDGAGGGVSLFSVENENVVIETVKAAEDGSGDIIVRMYETMRATTDTDFSTSLPVAAAAVVNMLEQDPEPLPLDQGRMALSLRPFEIKTVRLRLQK